MLKARSVAAGLVACLALAGCKGKDSGGTAGTALYLYDNANSQVLVWKDMDTLYTDATAATPTVPGADLTLTSAQFSNIGTLAWGGMAFDPSGGRLYLVSETNGTIVRIDSLRSLPTGGISNSYIAIITLDSSQRISTSSTFGQAAVDPATGTLYISEYVAGGGSSSQIWAITNPSQYPANGISTQATATQVYVLGKTDNGGMGATAGQGSVYGYFSGGNTITSGTSTYGGARLRQGGASGGFPIATGVLAGDQTGIQNSTTGTLAFDSSDSLVFVGVDTSTFTSGAPVLAFPTGLFSLSANQPPSFGLGDSSLSHLRVLAHPGNKDWLAGLTDPSGTGTGTGSIVVWRTPSTKTATTESITLGGSTSIYRGAAFDGDAN